MVSTVLAWHGSAELKSEVVARLRVHREQDELVQKVYQESAPGMEDSYRGCAIGCTLPPQEDFTSPTVGWHGEVERLYGIPRPVGRLIDAVFEGLPIVRGEHAEFAVAVIEAVPVGADLSLVSARLMLDLLVDPDRGVLRLTKPESAQAAAVDGVAALYRRVLDGRDVPVSEWRAARSAADAAAAAADAYDAAAAAYAAAAYAAYAAARADHWRWLASRLREHLGAAPVPVSV